MRRRTGVGRLRRGFTLFEIVAVFAIIAMIAGLSLPRLQGGTSRAKLRAIATEITSGLRMSRLEAIRSGNETHFTLDVANRSAEISGSTSTIISIPADVAISHEISTRCRQRGSVIEVVFLPNGRSCGSQITLSISGLRAMVRTNWLVGTSSLTLVDSNNAY